MKLNDRCGRMASGLALAAMLLAGAPLAGSAAPRNADPNAPPFVDFGRVLNEYQKTSAFAKHQQTIQERARVFGQEMETLAQLRYLTDVERKEALGLKAKPKPTDKDQARLEELTKKSDTIDNEAATLGQKQKPTEVETARIQEISQMRTEAAKNLAKEEADRRDQLRKLKDDLMEQVETDILKLVEKMAKDQKLSVIYERRAVVFGGVDFTDDVLKKLPK
jgi:Skp family chaperone for outer membrane proteins